jgi:hypothetical protein
MDAPDTPEAVRAALDRLPDTFQMHLRTPEISLATYQRIAMAEHAHKVRSRSRVYLDTFYWVKLRDVERGTSNDALASRLLSLLRHGRSRGKIVCPLSYSVVEELFGQSDLDSRVATAKLMDELSGAVCLQPPHHLFQFELESFLLNTLSIECPAPFDSAWTNVAFFVGTPTPQIDWLEPHQLLAMQKAFYDCSNGMTVAELAAIWAKSKTYAKQKERWQSTAETINREKGKPENHLKTFAEYYQSEIWGILDADRHLLREVVISLGQATGCVATPSAEAGAAVGDLLRRAIGNLVQAKKVTSQLPQLHISASLHAATRFDRSRKIKRTDFEDFRHARSAIPYCNAFITERSLSHLLTHAPLNLHNEFECQVIGNMGDAVQYLEKLIH